MLQPVTISEQHLAVLHDILLDGFTLNDFELAVFSIDRTIDSVSNSQSERFFDVLKQARREGWIEALVKSLHHRKPGNVALCDFVRDHLGPEHLDPRSAQATSSTADPFAVSFLRSNNSVPFVDRVTLRRHLRQMFDIENGPRIMAVFSDIPRCGKSYTFELIRFLARHFDHRTAYIDINEEWTADFDPARLAELLADKIGADTDDMPAREAQMARWNKELCRWLMRKIYASGAFWWIVIDGLSQAPGLTVDLQDFIHELAALVEKEDRPMHRLVLISFSVDGLPINLRARAIEETIQDRIGLQELTDFFTSQVQRVKTERNLSDADVQDVPQTLASWVHDELDGYPPDEQPYALELLIVKAMEQLLSLASQN